MSGIFICKSYSKASIPAVSVDIIYDYLSEKLVILLPYNTKTRPTIVLKLALYISLNLCLGEGILGTCQSSHLDVVVANMPQKFYIVLFKWPKIYFISPK
jgi:hypothetical protein